MTTTPAMPELPEPELGYIETNKSRQPAFSARQMRAAMQAQPAAAAVSDAEIDRICYLATEIRFAKTDDAAQAVIDKIRAILALRPQADPIGLDVEAMIRAVLPGGYSCDPQQVADAIRAYMALRPQAVPTLTNDQIAAERDRLSQGGDWFAGAVWARSMISSAATQAAPMTEVWFDGAMRLADAYADACFDQGLNQRTEDPNPETKREKLAEHLRGITAQAKEVQK